MNVMLFARRYSVNVLEVQAQSLGIGCVASYNPAQPGGTRKPVKSFTPGNADLPIGGLNKRDKPALPVSNLGTVGAGESAIQENGDPSKARPAWHSRGYLPHFESALALQHVTFHLADSLPRAALLRMEKELEEIPPARRETELRRRIEDWIDTGYGCCALREPAIAEITQAALLKFDSQRYRLLAWVIMPNHVHVLFQPKNGWTGAKIVASWKKFTARRIHNGRRTAGNNSKAAVWHPEYWDRYIRDQRHFRQAVQYIHTNPVKAGLVAEPSRWRWSSAFPGNADLLIGGF
jgi:putative transposase